MSGIVFVDANAALKARIGQEWGEVAAHHTHLTDGFSLVALVGDALAGLIALQYRTLPAPWTATYEGFIDIIEVHPLYRRQGIAAQLIRRACERLRAQGIYQVRAWSSEDKTAAIQMWKRLGFTLCPATTYVREQTVPGYFVAKLLQPRHHGAHS